MEGEFVYSPTPDTINRTNIMNFAQKTGFKDLKAFYDFADSNPEEFWDAVSKDCEISFNVPYQEVMDDSSGAPRTKWFIGAKVNIAYNTVGKRMNSLNPAIKFERENSDHGVITFSELNALSGKLAGSLLGMGVKKGDRVGIYMPLSPESVIALYAILRIGAVAVPIFSGYGAEAVKSRIVDAGIKVVFTFASYHRRGKEVRMLDNLQTIDAIKIVYGLGNESEDCLDFYGLIESGRYFGFEDTSAEDPAIMLYTSGTTGKPKGTVHVHGGALVNIVKEVKYYMDARETDTMFWISDPGWMMGPWSMIGSNALGASIFTYDGALDYPNEDRLWDLVSNHGVTLLGVSPTLIRSLKSKAQAEELKGVRVFGSTGEPWDTDSWMFLFERLGSSKVPIANISGGTDIIGCFLASTPAIPLSPRCLYRGLGMRVAVYDENGEEVIGKIGYLVAKGPSPSMTRGLWNQDEKYKETYWSKFPGVWNHGDWASADKDGYFFLYGRSDDVIKVAGKRVGPNEIEDIVSGIEDIVESAVVGIPDEVKGETLGIFYVSRNGKDLAGEITLKVQKSFGKAFSPGYVIGVPSLPKTKNGKIMRRIIKTAFLGQSVGDTSGLEDQGIVRMIAELGNKKLRGA